MMSAKPSKSFEEIQERYLAEAVATASPAARVVMLFDKLLADCARADAAFESVDWYGVNEALVNAQDILIYLSASLDVERWPEAGEQTRALYNFLYAELIEANLKKDRQRLDGVTPMIARLAEAWRSAAARLASEEAEVASPTPSEVGAAPGGGSPAALTGVAPGVERG